MKFETNIGLGEICVFNEVKNSKRAEKTEDLLVKVVAIVFEINSCSFIVEHVSSKTGIQRFSAAESQLIGDPDYDQNTGSY